MNGVARVTYYQILDVGEKYFNSLYEGQVSYANPSGFGRLVTTYEGDYFMFVGFFKPYPTIEPANNFYSLMS